MPSLAAIAVAVVAALAPAATGWWTGRRLAHADDDPALPELLLEREQRVARVLASAVAVILVFAPRTLWLALPLLLAGSTLAALPLRRALFGERIGALAWLEHGVRALVGGAGFWLLLAATPAIVTGMPAVLRPWAAGALALALLAWQARFAAIWLRCNAAAPFDRRDVEPLLRDVAVRSTAPMPRLARFGTPGVHLVNAYALPAMPTATAAFSRRLLELFEPEEIAAVFAHEMAHLEHHHPRRLRLGRLALALLVALTVALPFVAPAWFTTFFPLVLLIGLALRTQRARRHETDSDLRAVQLLGGDGEALVRALTKLHVLARIPRRMAAEMERSATHPSLARRVQAIRAAANDGAVTLPATAHVPGARVGAWTAAATPRHAQGAPARATPASATDASAVTAAVTSPVASPGASPVASPGASPVASPRAPDLRPHAASVAPGAAGAPVASAAPRAPSREPPSLARRLAAALPLPVLLQSVRARAVVALSHDRLYWFDDVPEDARMDVDALCAAAGSYRAVRYADVAELRVAAAGDQRQLVVRERAGDARRLALHPADVSLAQRALDLVDGQLGHAMPDRFAGVARLLAVVVLLLALLGSATGVATWVVAALALWWPSRPTLAALGVAGLLNAALEWLQHAPTGDAALVPLAQAVLGVLALALATRAPARDAVERRPHRATILAALLAVVAALPLGIVGMQLAAAPRGDRLATLAGGLAVPAAVTLLGALAAVLLARRVGAPGGTPVGALLGTAAVALGGALVAGERADTVGAWNEVTATVAARHALPDRALRVIASPSGARWAVQQSVARGAPMSDLLADGSDWELGSFGEGRARTLRALQLEFLDDMRVVALVRRGDSLEVRLEPAFAGEDPLPRRGTALPPLLNPVLRVDRGTGTWHVAGRPSPVVTGRPREVALEGTFMSEDDDAELPAMREAFGARADTMIVASGRIGHDSALVRRWVLPAIGHAVLPLADGGVLYQQMPRFDGATWRWMLGIAPRATLWRLGPDGARTPIATVDGVYCGSPGEDGEAMCVNRDARRLRGLVVGPHGDVRGHLALRTPLASMARPVGARLALASYERPEIVLLDAGTRRGTRATLGEQAAVIEAVPAGAGMLALRVGARGTELVALRVPR